MSWKQFSDACPGCRPALLDVKTGKPLPADDPAAMAVMTIWGRTTAKERRAFHRITCQNSRLPSDRRIMQEIVKRIQEVTVRMHPDGHV